MMKKKSNVVHYNFSKRISDNDLPSIKDKMKKINDRFKAASDKVGKDKLR